MSGRERFAWAALIALALVMRLWALGDRPPHHDESIHCNFGYTILTQGSYHYDPTYHGPLLFYVMAPLFAVLGATDAVGRLYPALAGVALVALPLALRRRLGRGTAFWTGVVAAISPVFLYYSRFARNDVPVALFTAAALALFLLVRRKGWRVIPWIGVAAAAHAISKETFYVTLPLLGAATFAVALRAGVARAARATAAWLWRYRFAVATAVLWFFVICMTAYTFFFLHPEDYFFPGKAIRYWYEQHKIQRVGGPWFYHLPRLALYEFLPVAAAAAWVIRRRSRLTSLELFCAVWGVSGIALYAYLGEKVPWLAVHQVLPFIPLAGAQLARTFSPRGRWWSQALAGIGLLATLWSAVASSYLHPAITTSDPHAELIVFVQTTPEEADLARLGNEMGQSHLGAEPVAFVSGEASWPLSWQWKKIQVRWSLPEQGAQPDIVVCDPDSESVVRERVGPSYAMRRIPLRAWWVEEYAGLKPLDVVKWFLTRKAWSPIGATDVLVFEAPNGGAERGPS